MREMLCAVACGVLACACLAISLLQCKEKGFLFHNAYIWASKQKRETMEKGRFYRQSGIAFAVMTAVFFIAAVICLLLSVI